MAKIESREQITESNLIAVEQWLTARKSNEVTLSHLVTYHEDGSFTQRYFLELEREDFLFMGGTLLTEPQDPEGYSGPLEGSDS